MRKEIKEELGNTYLELWLERWLDLTAFESVPVDAFEDGMILDFLPFSRTRPQSFFGALAEEAEDEILCIGRDEVGDVDGGLHGGLEHLLAVLGVEGRGADEHFIEHDTGAPPINSLSVCDTLQNFRS